MYIQITNQNMYLLIKKKAKCLWDCVDVKILSILEIDKFRNYSPINCSFLVIFDDVGVEIMSRHPDG